MKIARGLPQSVIEVSVALALVACSAALIRSAFFAGESQPAVAPVDAIPAQRLDTASILGETTAPVAIIEFLDFECPFCGRFARETLPDLRQQYIDKGKVLFAFKHLPLPIHKTAVLAAKAAECAGRQGQFWQLHDSLFNRRERLTEAALYSPLPNLDSSRFRICLSNPDDTRIRENQSEAKLLGVSGTPTFLIGRLKADGSVDVTNVLSGARPGTEFAAIIESLLISKGR